MRALEDACRALVRQLDAAVPLAGIADVHALCGAIGALRGRPIQAEPLPLSPPHSGLWLAGAQTDYIFYARDVSPLHEEHIILHELAHLLRGHRPNAQEEAEAFQRAWFTLLDVGAVSDALRTALSRSRYDVLFCVILPMTQQWCLAPHYQCAAADAVCDRTLRMTHTCSGGQREKRFTIDRIVVGSSDLLSTSECVTTPLISYRH